MKTLRLAAVAALLTGLCAGQAIELNSASVQQKADIRAALDIASFYQPLSANLTSWAALAPAAKENALGNPDVDGKVLSSYADGTREWITPGGGSSSSNYIIDATLPPYNAVGDAKRADAIAMTSGSNVLTSNGSIGNAVFAAGDVGKFIRVEGAGITPTCTFTLGTVSGQTGAVTGVTITNAGSTKAYPPNHTFIVMVYDVSPNRGAGAILTATTNANGQLSTLVVTVNGAAYTAPVASFPIACLETNISGITSSTQVILADTARQTVTVNVSDITVNKSAFLGTDSSAAVQAALDAAELSTTAKTVKIGNFGNYLFNVVVPRAITFEGMQSPNNDQGMITQKQEHDRKTYPVVLYPKSATQPVILCDRASFGVVVRNFAIAGSYSLSGDGLRGGKSGVPGWNFGMALFENIMTTGFERGITVSGATDSQVRNCSSSRNKIAFAGISADGIVFMVGNTNHCDRGYFFNGCKNISVVTGNYNNSNVCFEIHASQVDVGSINVESHASSVFDLHGDTGKTLVTANFVKLLDNLAPATNPAMVRDFTPEAKKGQADFSLRSSNISGGGQYFSVNTRPPSLLPPETGINLMDSTMTNILLRSNSSSLFGATANFSQAEIGNVSLPRIITNELFTRDWATPYGVRGWKRDIISGTFATPSANGGGINLENTTSIGSQRFMANPNWINNQDVRMNVKFAVFSTAGFLRVGIYPRETTASVTPADGLGIVANADGDGKIYLERRASGSVAELIDTGLTNSIYINKKVNLVFRLGAPFFYFAAFDATGALLAPEVRVASTLPSVLVGPALFSGTTTAAFVNGPVIYQWDTNSGKQ